MRAGLDVNRQGIRAAFDKRPVIPTGLDQHQVDVKRELGRSADGRDDHWPEAQVGDKPPIHHVDVDAVDVASGVELRDLFGESTEVGREDRGSEPRGAGLVRHPTFRPRARPCGGAGG